MQLRIVFCTTCKGRLQHLKETLHKNITDNRDYENAVFVVLDYGSQDGLSYHLRTNFPVEIAAGKLVVYRFENSGPFRMAHAKNMAHRCGILEGADILVNLDSDNFTGAGFADYVNNQTIGYSDAFLWSRMIKDGPERLPRGISGRIAVHRDQFLCVGGYDERFEAWGPDDMDFNARLRRLGNLSLEIDSRFLKAIQHPDKMRFREYPKAAATCGEDSVLPESDATIANWGQFGMGTVYRNFSHEPIVLGPVPTRIFGIGMHKTATTSLHTALRILGFKSGHWQNAHWAKAIYQEMSGAGRSRTLEQFYALSDLPIPVLFRELDAAYPGSKFILTVRNEWVWLESVRRHWSHEHNKFRVNWSVDPFTHKIHRVLYGQKGFDAKIFIDRYRQHNREVMEYFRDRPNDLLVIDMNLAAEKWEELCRFLDTEIPKVPYPHHFKTPAIEPEYSI